MLYLHCVSGIVVPLGAYDRAIESGFDNGACRSGNIYERMAGRNICLGYHAFERTEEMAAFNRKIALLSICRYAELLFFLDFLPENRIRPLNLSEVCVLGQ